MSTLQQFLQATPVESLGTPTSQIVRVAPTDSITSVLSTLFKHNILSAPVFDNKNGVYVGILDMLDLVTVIAEVFAEGDLKGLSLSKLSATQSEALEAHFRFQKQFVTGCTIDHMAGVSAANPVVPVRVGTDLLTALKDMIQFKAHRMPVMSDDTTITSYISQSTILAFLSKNLDKIDQALLKQSVASLKLGEAKPVTVEQHEPAIMAFRAMCRNKVSGVPIVDGCNRFIGVISAKDIKGIGERADDFACLYLSVLDFIAKVRQSDLSIVEKSPTIAVYSSDSLLLTIQRLVATRVHRVVVVDKESRVVKGVISLGDVLRVLVQ